MWKQHLSTRWLFLLQHLELLTSSTCDVCARYLTGRSDLINNSDFISTHEKDITQWGFHGFHWNTPFVEDEHWLASSLATSRCAFLIQQTMEFIFCLVKYLETLPPCQISATPHHMIILPKTIAAIDSDIRVLADQVTLQSGRGQCMETYGWFCG